MYLNVTVMTGTVKLCWCSLMESTCARLNLLVCKMMVFVRLKAELSNESKHQHSHFLLPVNSQTAAFRKHFKVCLLSVKFCMKIKEIFVKSYILNLNVTECLFVLIRGFTLFLWVRERVCLAHLDHFTDCFQCVCVIRTAVRLGWL